MVYIGRIESAEGEATALSKTLLRNVAKTAGSGMFNGADSSAVHMVAYWYFNERNSLNNIGKCSCAHYKIQNLKLWHGSEES